MADATEKRVDERLVPQKRLPFGIVKIRCNNCGFAAVAFLHQLEENVGLFGFEIEIAQLVDVQDVDPDQRVEETPRRAIRQ